MALPRQTTAILRAAGVVASALPADAVLLLLEANLDWDAVREALGPNRLFVAVEKKPLAEKLRQLGGLEVLELEGTNVPVAERISVALLKAIAAEKLQPGSHLVVVSNSIAVDPKRPEPMDTINILHLSEHLERMTAQDLRKLETKVPLETLRLVVDLAMEIGREGRESKPVGTLLVVGDTRRVLSMSRPINFNPFRGYSRKERDLRDRRVREQIKDIAQLDGAIVIASDGIAVAACLYLDVPSEGITLGKGLGSRHWSAASISKRSEAIAVVVSQSSGTVRLFQNGEVVLHIEPLARPHVWQPFRTEKTERESANSF